MRRTAFVFAVLLTLPCPHGADARPAPTETVIRLHVKPAAAPKPALKYQLLPELREINPGNAVQGYMKCFAEQNPFFFSKEAIDERERLQEMPLKDLPKLRDYGGIALRQADYAARLETVDWQLLLKLKSDGFETLIPEVQQMRQLASALKVRFRGAVAERRFDDALTNAKTMFGMARHLSEQPSLIGDLVGLAIAFIAVDPLDEMLQQPGCPNLFWALTDLPQPFIDLRKGIQGERVAAAKEFELFDDKTPMSEAQLKKVVDRFNAVFFWGGKQQDPEWIARHAMDKTFVQAARQRLLEHGLAEEKIKLFPALQVVLLDGKLTFDVLRDERFRAMNLPYWQGEPLLAASHTKAIKEASPFAAAAPYVSKVRGGQVRLEQRFALLRCVEALRMYAAEHDGNLPAQLADIKLPLPIDPVNGKAFLYKLENGTASLRGTAPPGYEKFAVYNIRYEVTISK